MGKLPTSKSGYIKTVYTTSENILVYYNKISRGQLNEIVPVANEEIWIVMPTMYFQKYSGFVPTMNLYIDRFIANGIISKWENDYTDVKRERMRSERVPQIMTLEQVHGVFYLCCGLYAIATVVFMVEVLSTVRIIKKYSIDGILHTI